MKSGFFGNGMVMESGMLFFSVSQCFLQCTFRQNMDPTSSNSPCLGRRSVLPPVVDIYLVIHGNPCLIKKINESKECD